MKTFTLFICLTVFIHFISKAQIKNLTLIKKLSINGFCLCQITTADLKNTYKDLKEVSIEEMDLPIGCVGQDSRFIAGKGYFSNSQPGIVFQKDQTSEYISKFRLTKDFKGKLPDDNYIEVGKLLLKDIFKMYPQLKDTWGSRGCSNYWNFSNDTLSFYVKIDVAKKPQFPIDEAYYLNKPIEAVDLLVSCYDSKKIHSESNKQIELFDPNDPIFFIDSVRVNKAVLANYTPGEIAKVTVYKDTSAINRLGIAAKNGLIYIETKNYARFSYQAYFKSKSKDYAKLITSNDSTIQYVLNNKVLKDNYESDLASINDKVFKEIKIINKAKLLLYYGIKDKDYGVVITIIKP